MDVDAAAESFATRGGAVAALASELGLADDLVLPARLAGVARGRARSAHPLPAASVLGIPADPRAKDVVAAIGRLGAWRAQLDAVVPLRRPESYRSLGDLVRRRMGAARAAAASSRRWCAASTRPRRTRSRSRPPRPGLPDALRASRSLGAAVERLRAASPAGSQVAGLRGGVHRLAAALERDARAAGAQFVLGARVVRSDAAGVRLDSGERLARARRERRSADAAGPRRAHAHDHGRDRRRRCGRPR